MRFVVLSGLVMAAAPAGAWSTGGSAAARPATGSAGAAQATARPVTYRLVDTLADAPWTLTASRFGRVGDVSSAPDGTVYVLDTRHNAIHVLGPDGEPRGVFRVPLPGAEEDGWSALRLDAGFDGTLSVLCLGPYEAFSTRPARVLRLAADGRLLTSFDVDAGRQAMYVDIAVRDDGRTYLVRVGPQNPFIIWPSPDPTPTPLPPDAPPTNGVDVFDASGVLLETLHPDEMRVPYGVDVGTDGTVYVINRVPVPWSEPGPGATPTPRPSWVSVPTQARQFVEGIMRFTPEHAYAGTTRFSGAEDLAVGPAGVYVSRQVDIFRLGQNTPLYTGPVGQVESALYGNIVFHLDAPRAGGLTAGMNHCYFQGLLLFAGTYDRLSLPRLVGSLDRPELEGPVYPLRTAAGEELATLQGRYTIVGDRPEQEYLSEQYAAEPQTVQRWSLGGALDSQLGVCSSSESWWARDIAVDGRDVYTIDAHLLTLRPDDKLPAWTYWPAVTLPPEQDARLVAVAARGGRAAVLDANSRRVSIVDRSGQLESEWLVGGSSGALLVDLAMDTDRLYVADAGRSRILVRDVAGQDLGAWPLADGPVGVAVGPTGDVFVMGAGHWAFRYDPFGRLLAQWPMPNRSYDAGDIAVDGSGRVYVPFFGRSRQDEEAPVRRYPEFFIAPAGVWVFDPVPLPDNAAGPGGGCRTYRDKTVRPGRIPLGDEVEVALAVAGECPGAWDPVQVAVLFDTSRSMNWNGVLDRAKDATHAFLRTLRPGAAEVALVTFADRAALRLPLTGDLGTVDAEVASLQAWGDTRLATGLDAAGAELSGPGKDPAAHQAVLLVTDAVYKDSPAASAAALEAKGIDLYVLMFPTSEFRQEHLLAMTDLVSDKDRLLLDPERGLLEELAREITHFRAVPGLFERLAVTDMVPGNMRYVTGSAAPAAVWDASSRELRWTLTDVTSAESLELRYRLEPLVAGTWPTNVSAKADYVDKLGQAGQLVFPIPLVDVFEMSNLVYLPYGANRACFPPSSPLDVVLVIDASSSMSERAPGGGTKLDAAREAATTFVGLLRLPLDRAAVVSFSTQARSLTGLTGSEDVLRTALLSLASSPGTRIDRGITAASAILSASARSEARPVVIVLSDGHQGGPRDPVLAAADALRAAGARVYSVGLGAAVDRALLTEVAGSEKRYFESPTPADLETIFRVLSDRLVCGQGP